MNPDTTRSILPTLTTDLLTRADIQVDNLFSTMWQRLGFKALLSRSGFKKRSGAPASDVVYLLLLWVWLKVDSIGMFSKDSLQSFSAAKKDALYDFLNREDLNWRKLQLLTAKKVIGSTDNSALRAFVVDDSVKIRRGKKMPGVSSHFDHLTGRCVMGQQILTLGLATEAQFVPLDNEIFISNTKAQPLTKDFTDGRSIVAKRYRQAQEQSKPEMVRDMISRALRADINAQFFLADAWFATKPILKLTEEKLLIAIVRMKKNKMKYRLMTASGAYLSLCAADLYKGQVKGQWTKIKGRPYQSKSITVELNLAQSNKDNDHWISVKLLFVRGVNEEKQQAGKNDWALFLSTDSNLSDEKVLEVYALRWGIEVYFKEAKQKLGFLKEQSIHYSTYIASIHLTAIRFCLLLFAKHENGTSRLSDSRNEMIDSLCTLDFASRLWGVFRALIAGALDELKLPSGEGSIDIMGHIERTVTQFFEQVMQMDSFTLRLEGESSGD
jgi:SRSO17 transposase